MPQWPKLGRWSPSFTPVQRSHDSPHVGPTRTLLKPMFPYIFSLFNQQQRFFKTPTFIELISSPEEEKLAPKWCFSEENSSLHPWKLVILSPSENGSRTLDHTQSSNNMSQTAMNHDKRDQYLLFENQTGFFLDLQDFQCLSRQRRVSFWPIFER